MTLRLNRDWSEFLLALIDHRVRFVIVGGHAVAVHAEPRFTKDLDVFVEPTRANARRVRAALVEFGFGAVLRETDAFEVPDQVWMLGRPPRRIDLITGIDGVGFAAAWKDRVPVDLEGRTVFVIGRQALIRNKRASGRPVDLVDLDLLERHGRQRLKRKPRRK